MSTNVTVTQRPINRGALRLALAHLRSIRAARTAYDEDVAAWYRSGEGRSPKWHTFWEDGEPFTANVGGKGYVFPACIHGTSRWTDYDNICGPCESGESDLQLALYEGHADWSRWMDRASVVQYAHDQHVPYDIVEQLRDWSMEAMAVLDRHPRVVRNLP